MNNKHTFINEYIAQSVKEKGFCVYNYISLRELILTVQKDYLGIITLVNIPFAILTVILGIVVYSSGNIMPMIVFMGLCYGCIFMYLFFRLVIKTYYYLLVSNVVYGTQGLILGNRLYTYKDHTETLEKNLEKYELIFDEYLSKASELPDVVEQKKTELFSSTGKTLEKGGKLLSQALENSNSRNSSKIMIPIVLSFMVYVVCLYVFYYVGYFLGYVLFYVYSVFIKIFLSFKKNTALKIKDKVFSMHNSFVKMDMIYITLQKKLQIFSDGEISDISGFVEQSFTQFYSYVSTNMRQKQELIDFLYKKELSGFIDMKRVAKHLGEQFKLPVTDMLELLKKYETITQNGISELNKTKTTSKNFTANILQKKKVLQYNLEQIQSNIYKLEQIVR